MPAKAEAAKPTQTDLKPSKALSILLNVHETFEGRKVGMLVTNGVDSGVVAAMKKALDKEGATFEFIAPTISGVKASDGSVIPANQKIGGGPSVLYDAVALLVSNEGAEIALPMNRRFAILLPMRLLIRSTSVIPKPLDLF